MKNKRKKKILILGSIIVVLVVVIILGMLYQRYNYYKNYVLNNAIVIEAANPTDGSEKVETKIDEIIKPQDPNYKVLSGKINNYNKKIFHVFKINVNGQTQTIIFDITSFINYHQA